MQVKIKCFWCNKNILILEKEYNYQKKKGRKYFFCSRSCSSKYGNNIREDRTERIENKCLQCQTIFTTVTGSRERKYCSRFCASAGSVTDHRREKAKMVGSKNIKKEGIKTVAASLRKREFWKYKRISYFLNFINEPHEFEYPLGKYIYDLALVKKKILIEFDGKEHRINSAKNNDNAKNLFAHKKQWVIFRIPTSRPGIISPEILYPILKNLPVA